MTFLLKLQQTRTLNTKPFLDCSGELFRVFESNGNFFNFLDTRNPFGTSSETRLFCFRSLIENSKKHFLHAVRNSTLI